MSKSFIHFKDLTKQEIFAIFDLANQLEKGSYKEKPLQGKTIVLFFPESSIRTRVTFEKGIEMLGGQTILFPPSALDKKEDIKDVIGYLENWADAVVVRHSNLALLETMAEYANIPIINAMTSENHPCEILSDLYALSKLREDFLQDNYLFVGEKGNIGNSWKAASTVMGFALEQCCPVGYELTDVKAYQSIEEAIPGKDIICTDSIPAEEKEKFAEIKIGLKQMKMANKNAILNPCPPFYRGEIVEKDVIDSDYFVGYKFKYCLLQVQQAVLCFLLG